MTDLATVAAPGDQLARYADHSPAAVLSEFDDWNKVPRHWVRMARRGCDDCARWDATHARLSALRRSYRRRAIRRRPASR